VLEEAARRIAELKKSGLQTKLLGRLVQGIGIKPKKRTISIDEDMADMIE